jgi:hypothetical protein
MPTLEELAGMPNRELRRIHAAGTAPRLEELAGKEYCGFNRPVWFDALRARKFIKGFFMPAGQESPAAERIAGYNIRTVQNGLVRSWELPDESRPNRFGFFIVRPVPGAVLLDYAASQKNVRISPLRLIRDLVVEVEPGNSAVLLGKAMLAMAPGRWVFSNFFILQYRRATDWRTERG